MITYLVVGLGNPDDSYLNTRHNLGYMFVDALAKRYHYGWNEFKNIAKITEFEVGDKKLILMKSHSYMNESGTAVQAVAAYFKIKPKNIIVTYDDIALDVGRLRLAINKSSGGHNGVQSIIDQLGGSDFIRLRLGIGPQKGPAEKYVLTRIPTIQKRYVTDTIDRGIGCLQTLLDHGLELAATEYNGSKPE